MPAQTEEIEARSEADGELLAFLEDATSWPERCDVIARFLLAKACRARFAEIEFGPVVHDRIDRVWCFVIETSDPYADGGRHSTEISFTRGTSMAAAKASRGDLLSEVLGQSCWFLND